MANRERKFNSAVEDNTLKVGASGKGTVYCSATTGLYVTRSADRDPSARKIRERFRAVGRRFSDSSELVREDRDSCFHPNTTHMQ